ncbi:ABC transporter substrate-binding protein [Aquibacillus koreensis]|uniref:ABC transporter substrate-binding protein n=1 Tax=Aquibacillus koreensis TaxID=279446 RepID=A0A9X4AI23_9BACI|nr:ABC transporter substrate-binding protein [Aquibacillus koreensis]MCT2535838.1 ABC transporter substrate-binding protein [Aquibacillus koreensis]MDC3420294.1 ABC transporter substrate-binding protein [Aquibacillus koreensis]
MKKVYISLLSIIFVLLISACSQDNGDTDTEVKIAEVTRSIFYAPQYIALEEGFFEEEGLDVELQTIAGGDKVMTSLLSDNSDIGLVGSETSIYVKARGAEDPIINFAQLTQTDGTFLVAREPNDNFEFDQLKGSVFLGQRKGGMPQMVGEHVLKQNNIDPDNDLELIQNIDFANIASSFSSGTGEYVQLFEPTASQFEKDGIGHVIASFGEESGKVPYTVFMTKESYMNENEETIKKFTRAIYKAQQFVQEHSAAEIAEIVQPYFEDTDLDLLESSVERYKSQNSYADNPILDEEEWNNLKDIMDGSGELPEDIPYEDLVNSQIAEDVISE